MNRKALFIAILLTIMVGLAASSCKKNCPECQVEYQKFERDTGKIVDSDSYSEKNCDREFGETHRESLIVKEDGVEYGETYVYTCKSEN